MSDKNDSANQIIELQQQMEVMRKTISEQNKAIELLIQERRHTDQSDASLNPELNASDQTLSKESDVNTTIPKSTDNTSTESEKSIKAVEHMEVDIRGVQLQPLIRNYSHPNKSGPPEKWIKWYERATNEVGWSDQKKADNMQVYLEDQADTWCINLKITDWTQIKQKLHRLF